MKFLFAFSVLLLASFSLFGQNYAIEYNHVVSFDALTTKAVYELTTSPQASTYIQLKNDLIANTASEVKPTNIGVVPFVRKDYVQKQLHYNQPITNKIFFVADQLPLQTWKLHDETRNIQAFTCKKASTTFRGRTYVAWYTTDIPVLGGPWKFDGLPGLILAVVSTDGALSIEATKIAVASKALPHLDYDAKKLISWEAYCAQYRQTLSRIKKSMQANAEPDVEMNLTVSLIEDIGL